MKCGSCRNKDADAYTRIKPDNKLFELLKTLNPKYAYNPKYSLYCNDCIKLAEAKLVNQSTTNTSATVSCLNPSISTNNSGHSDGSMDEYDSLIPAIVFSDKGTPLVYPPEQSKRPADPASRPGPKSRKKPFAPLQLEKIPEIPSSQHVSVSSQPNSNEMSSEQRSLSNPERHVLIGAIADSSSSVDEPYTQTSSNNVLLLVGADDSSLSADDEQPRKTTPKPVPDSSMSLSSKDLQATSRSKRKSTARHNDDSDVSKASNRQTGASGALPSAPAAQNPRQRELRDFFSVHHVGVNNFARLLGG